MGIPVGFLIRIGTNPEIGSVVFAGFIAFGFLIACVGMLIHMCGPCQDKPRENFDNIKKPLENKNVITTWQDLSTFPFF